jgi:hypothetical protein
LGHADGTFDPATAYPVTKPFKLAIGDFNNDGKSDLAIPNSYDFSTTVSVLLGHGDGTFQSALNFVGTALTPVGVTVGDFNADGKADLAIGNQADQNGADNVSILLNTTIPTILTAQQQIGLIKDQITSLTTTNALAKTPAHALTVKLDAALDSLNRGNKTAGVNQLKAFINQVNALKKAGTLSATVASALIDGANHAILLAMA